MQQTHVVGGGGGGGGGGQRSSERKMDRGEHMHREDDATTMRR